MFRQHVAIQPKLSRVIVILTYVDSSSHSELLKGGMVYRKASLAASRSTRSRMVSMQRGRSRWATSWTNQSAWPSGHTRSVDSSPEQVRPHLVSYLVSYYRIRLHRNTSLLLLSLLEETPLFHAAELTEYYKVPLTGSYTVILTVGDM